MPIVFFIVSTCFHNFSYERKCKSTPHRKGATSHNRTVATLPSACPRALFAVPQNDRHPDLCKNANTVMAVATDSHRVPLSPYENRSGRIHLELQVFIIPTHNNTKPSNVNKRISECKNIIFIIISFCIDMEIPVFYNYL